MHMGMKYRYSSPNMIEILSLHPVPSPPRCPLPPSSREVRLSAGQLVSFTDAQHRLLVVQPDHHGKSYRLHPSSTPPTLPPNQPYAAPARLEPLVLPPEALFWCEFRPPRSWNFRSLAAQGRTLQAQRAPQHPHRVHNYNTGM